MRKVYYTKLATIDTDIHFYIEVQDLKFEVKLPVSITMIGGANNHLIQNKLYDAVKERLNTDQFFLVPSEHETSMNAMYEDMYYHPEKYPMGGGSCNPWGGGGD